MVIFSVLILAIRRSYDGATTDMKVAVHKVGMLNTPNHTTEFRFILTASLCRICN